MKKILLILLCSLFSLTSFAQPPVIYQSCLNHQIFSSGFGIPHHVATITYDASAGGSPVYLWIGGSGPYSPISIEAVGSEWVYQYDLGTISFIDPDDPCINQVRPTLTTTAPSVTDPSYEMCHCDNGVLDACVTMRKNGNSTLVSVTVIFGPDIQGIDRNFWYYDGSAFQGPFLPSSKTFVGGVWVYTFNFSTTGLVFTPIDIYNTSTLTSADPGSPSSPHAQAPKCGPDMRFACYDRVPYQGPGQGLPHDIAKVVYGPGIAGLDVYIWVYSGGVFYGPVAPTSKTLVNGFWVYEYDLGAYDPSNPGICYSLYPTMSPGTPPDVLDQNYTACRCKDCDATFSYCMSTLSPGTVTININTPNPLWHMVVTDGTNVLYSGPAIPSVLYYPTGGNVDIKVTMTREGEDPCEFTIPACFPDK